MTPAEQDFRSLIAFITALIKEVIVTGTQVDAIL